MTYTGRLNIFNSYEPQIRERSVETTLAETDRYYAPFLQLLGARWLVAADHDTEHNLKVINNLKDADSDFIVTHDWFVSDMRRYDAEIGVLQNFQGRILVFSDLPNETWTSPYHGACMNCFRADPDRLSPDAGRHTYELYRNANHTFPVVKMGCANSWLPTVHHSDRTIFLDEPHPSVVESYNSRTGFRGQLYRHALQVCRILHQKHGFRVITFFRENSHAIDTVWSKYDFLEKISVGHWVPFKNLIDHYARASLFYSYTHETYGFPCYENLQLGNAVIGYADTHDPYAFKQFQNAVLLSSEMSADMSADLIVAYFEIYHHRNLRSQISRWSQDLYGCESFMPRLREAIGAYFG